MFKASRGTEPNANDLITDGLLAVGLPALLNSQSITLNSSSISSFEFDDGSVLSVSDLLARGFDLDGTAGDDDLFGRSKCEAANDVRYESERGAA